MQSERIFTKKAPVQPSIEVHQNIIKESVSLSKKILSGIGKIFLFIIFLFSMGMANVLAKSVGIFGYVIFGICFLMYWVLGKSKREVSNWYKIALSAQIGHLSWFIFSTLMPKAYLAVSVDIAALTIGSIWFFLRPQTLSTVLLSAYQIIGIAINIYAYGQVPSDFQVYIILHILLRLTSLTGLICNLLLNEEIRSSKDFSGQSEKQRTLLDEIHEVVVKGLRNYAAQNDCAPTEKTSDKKIIEIYSKVATAFRQAADQRGEELSAGILNCIVLYFLQRYEKMGDEIIDSHLGYEIDKYLTSGLRPAYQQELHLL